MKQQTNSVEDKRFSKDLLDDLAYEPIELVELEPSINRELVDQELNWGAEYAH